VKKTTVKKAAEKPAVDPHAGHDMSSMPGMEMPAELSKADPHAGHVLRTETTAVPGVHAGHDMSAMTVELPVGPPPPEALNGPQNAADTVWGQAAMDPSRAVLLGEHGSMRAGKLLIDQLETRVRKGRDGYFVNAEGWYGGDIDKLWLKTEVEGAYGSEPEQAELQALLSHAIDPWFNLQAGARLDTRPDTRGHLVLGVEGLAPYWIEVDAAAFLSDKGNVTARVEAEHDMRLTQKLILQPRVEFDFAAQDIPRERIGSGISSAELGLRLRYQFVPQFAPYIGINYERAFSDTRRFRRIDGEDLGGWQFVAGLRTWF
jgi:copper resistance protein B